MSGFEPATLRTRVKCPNHSTIPDHSKGKFDSPNPTSSQVNFSTLSSGGTAMILWIWEMNRPSAGIAQLLKINPNRFVVQHLVLNTICSGNHQPSSSAVKALNKERRRHKCSLDKERSNQRPETLRTGVVWFRTCNPSNKGQVS